MLADVKTLVTIGDAELRAGHLDRPQRSCRASRRRFEVRIPPGYEVSAVSGASLERHADPPGRVVLFVSNPAQRRHQFLVSLERSSSGGSFKLDTSNSDAAVGAAGDREIAVEGIGTLEISVRGDTGTPSDGRPRGRSRARICGAAIAARGVPL